MTAFETPETVHLTYGHDDGSWWVESEQLPSLFAGGDSLDDAKELARQAVREEFGESVSIVDWVPAPAGLAPVIGEQEPVIASKGAASRGPAVTDWAGSDPHPALKWFLPVETINT